MSNDEKVLTGYSQIEKTEFTFKWVISDCLLILESGNGSIKSPIFHKNGDDDTKFRLQLQKCSYSSNSNQCLEYRHLSLLNILRFTNSLCQYKIAILKDDQVIETYTEDPYSTSCREKEIFNITIDDFKKFISSTGTIVIRCELKISAGSQKNSLNYESVDVNEVPETKLKFDWILLDENLSDIKLKTACGKKIPAHRIMLATASPVFRAMFNHDMLENKSEIVDMIDVSHDSAVEMLRYIYTSTVETQEFCKTAELLVAADKYQLEELKNKCEQILISNISAKNAIEALTIAVNYNLSCLKKNAINLIKRIINGPTVSDDFGTMILKMAQFLSE
ncbi:speckle-type POZ protein B-like [Trichogramma pretiosum]|uniref:speckle-type POZ protein B-like n=1 Tax=Trichogramma pretiosum TaxID=7493 RepID=UPI0006C93D81|nr:speckle-type POZ protein B-like [Trichogramma pretiosum]